MHSRQKAPQHPEGPWGCPIIAMSSSLPHPSFSLTPDNQYCVLCFYHAATSRMPWNHHIVCDPWSWLFTLSKILWRFLQDVGCTSHPLIFIPWCVRTTVCLATHSLKGTWVVSSLRLYLETKLLWTFTYRFLCEQNSSFLWHTCPRVKCSTVWQLQV